MGEWKKRSKEDWKPRLFPGLPPIPMEVVKRIQATRGTPKPDPFMVMTGGLRHGDDLFIDWMAGIGQYQYEGCRIAAYRGRVLLRWAPAGWLRDAGGKCLYAPYLRSWSEVSSFVEMFAMGCGHTPVPKDEGPTYRRFVLETTAGESRRLILGDRLHFDGQEKTVQVQRSQGTVDMNLYRPGPGSNCVMMSPVDYVSMAHHTTVIAHAMAEANGLWVRPLGSDTFEVIHPN